MGRFLDDVTSRRRRRAWILFAILGLAIPIVDQLLKRWIVANYRLNEPVQVVGDWLRIDFIHNSGGLFGLFQNSVGAFAVATIVVIALIVALEFRSGWRSWFVTLALALLLGGAIGNLIDRIRLGYVVDFADMGVGAWRWYIFNVADSAVTVAIALLFILAFLAPKALSLDLDDPVDGAIDRPRREPRPVQSGAGGESGDLAASGDGLPDHAGDEQPAGDSPGDTGDRSGPVGG